MRPRTTTPELTDLLNEMRQLSADASTDAEVRAVISRVAQITRTYRITNGIGIPTTPLLQAMELDPGYVSLPHVELLSAQVAQAVRDVERGRNRMLAVSMPPRAGKSTLLSLYTPLWLLRRHPEWKIISSSHDGGLATGWARSIRHMIEDKPDLGIALARDGGAGSMWETVEGGGLFSVSVRGALTGRGARVMVIDDPVKDFVEAHSLLLRQNLWDWWLSVALTRMEPPYLVVVVMCMTGDTLVLRPDGSETPLGDIRPGDEIATYEDGHLATSTVVNWANQGPDDIFVIRMESGRTVRANSRHPFLTVDENGVESWRRTDQLGPGSKVLCARAPGPVSSALSAHVPPSARDSAQRTTTRPAGWRVIDRRRSTPTLAELRGSSIATVLQRMNTETSLVPSEDSVPSVDEHLTPEDHQRTGPGNSASIMTTTPGSSEDSSAMTATSSSSGSSPPSDSEQPLTTWSVTPDRVIEVVWAGREDVFDLQVERTENFIANGLVSHNTRWHEDDFIGRLFSDDFEGDPKQWERISLPAIADRPDDPLGRAEGEPLFSPVLKETTSEAVERWADVRRAVGTYTFSSMYQQRPAPAKGAIFDSGWWRFWTSDENRVTEDGRIVHLDPSSLTGGRWLDSWDMAFKSSVGGDSGWVVGQRWVRNRANRYLIAQQRGRWSFTQTIAAMERWAVTDSPFLSRCGHLVHERHVEERANGAAIIDVLKDTISGLKPINPVISKESRARAVTPEIESGNVYLPHPGDPGNEWVNDLLSELRNFPHDTADDQVDALTQALSGLRQAGKGSITIPGRMQTNRPQLQVTRNIARTAQSDRRRGIA